jgi:uncharacterized protein
MQKGQRPDFTGFFFDRAPSRAYDAPAMSEGRLPERIDPYRFAETRRILEGRLKIASMRRLADHLADDSGEVRVQLEFGVDKEGVRYVRGRLRADLVLRCQRCLGEMTLPVESEICLGMIADESLADRLEEPYEPLVVGDEPLYLRDIIEDELILALPVVARHEDAACAGGTTSGPEDEQVSGSGEERENPFAALAELKTNRKP